MNRRADFLAERIDRRREHEQARTERTARQKTLEARASAFIACEVAELPEDDRPDFVQSLAAAIRVQLVALHGAAPASSILGQQAYEAARGILPRVIAKASADQAFARLTSAANDRGGE